MLCGSHIGGLIGEALPIRPAELTRSSLAHVRNARPVWSGPLVTRSVRSRENWTAPLHVGKPDTVDKLPLKRAVIPPGDNDRRVRIDDGAAGRGGAAVLRFLPRRSRSARPPAASDRCCRSAGTAAASRKGREQHRRAMAAGLGEAPPDGLRNLIIAAVGGQALLRWNLPDDRRVVRWLDRLPARAAVHDPRGSSSSKRAPVET